MTSKVEPSENYWTNDVKIFAILNQWRQKYSPPPIIEPLTEKTWGQGCVIFGEWKNKERNGETPLRRRKYLIWMNNKATIEFGFRRIWTENSADPGGCYPPRPSASVDNSLLDLQNSSYPTHPHSIIAKYLYKFWVLFSIFTFACFLQVLQNSRSNIAPFLFLFVCFKFWTILCLVSRHCSFCHCLS